MEISFIPQGILKQFYSDSQQQYEFNILISNIFVIIVVLILKNSLIDFLNLIPHFCLFKMLVGIECPFCGMTRAFCAMGNLNLKQAFILNPASIIIVSFLFLQIPLRLLSICLPIHINKVRKISRYYSNIVLMMVLTNWIIITTRIL